MKTIIALAALAVLSTASFAATKDCHPVTGNWVNAATQSCAYPSDGKSEGFPKGNHYRCEEAKS